MTDTDSQTTRFGFNKEEMKRLAEVRKVGKMVITPTEIERIVDVVKEVREIDSHWLGMLSTVEVAIHNPNSRPYNMANFIKPLDEYMGRMRKYDWIYSDRITQLGELMAQVREYEPCGEEKPVNSSVWNQIMEERAAKEQEGAVAGSNGNSQAIKSEKEALGV